MLTALIEYFRLRRAAEVVDGVAPDLHRRARARLLLARQKAASADKLWRHDHPAEALALLRVGLDEALAAARLLAGDGGDWAAVLRSGGASAAEVGAVAEAKRAADEEALPVLDDDVGPRLEALRAEIEDAFEALDRALGPMLSSHAELAARRRWRAGGVAVAVLVAGAFGARAARRERPAAAASAYLTTEPGFPAANVVDGKEGTEWILPHGTSGWVDVTFTRPRAVRAVRLLNAHNREHNDVGTRDYRVDVFAGERLVGTARGTFPSISPLGTWMNHPFDARDVTRVRVWVDSFHGAAGGLGEVTVE